MGLDALRFVAAFAVLAYHFTARDSSAWGEGRHPWEVWPDVFRVTRYGHLGVQLFFVISGFVILMSAWGRTPRAFVVSRATRLLPAYWVAVLATGFLLVVLWPVGDVAVWEVVTNLTMVQSALGVAHVDGVYWTLFAELLFYVLVTLLLLVGLTRGRVLVLVLVWPPLAALAHTSGQDLLATLLNWYTAPFFCLGMVLYLIHRWGPSLLHLLLLGYSCALAVGVTATRFPDGAPSVTGATPSLGVVLGTVSVIPLLVWAAARFAPRGRAWRWLTVLGALTYPLYLLHEYWGWYVLHLVAPRLDRWAALALAIAVCLALAWAVHRLVERPLAPRLRRALQQGLDEAAAESASGAAADPGRTSASTTA
ncbi:acyltransferase family protein [Phycicoccus sp. HDW14]|uniref:acyltransferase family protein n=1 Tax=Phycicoccus sp. HDW14 TaxID=2714941 RepID=UPI00352FF442